MTHLVQFLLFRSVQHEVKRGRKVHSSHVLESEVPESAGGVGDFSVELALIVASYVHYEHVLAAVYQKESWCLASALEEVVEAGVQQSVHKEYRVIAICTQT